MNISMVLVTGQEVSGIVESLVESPEAVCLHQLNAALYNTDNSCNMSRS